MSVLDSDTQRIYESVMASPHAMVCLLATDGAIQFANEAFCRYWKVDPDTLPGTDYASLFAEDEREDIQRRLAVSISRPHSVVIEHLVKLSDGREDWHECELQPTRDSAGEIVGLLVVTRETTERRVRELEAVKNKARLDDVQRLARLGSWEWDIAASRVAMSESLQMILGIDADGGTVTFDGFLDLVHPDDRTFVEENLRQTVEAGTDYTVDHRVVCRDGSIRYLKGAGQVQKDEQGEPARLIGMSQDVTDETHAVKALQASEARVRAIIDATVRCHYHDQRRKRDPVVQQVCRAHLWLPGRRGNGQERVHAHAGSASR
jgi:PAS domain S-box-containing protein